MMNLAYIYVHVSARLATIVQQRKWSLLASHTSISVHHLPSCSWGLQRTESQAPS